MFFLLLPASIAAMGARQPTAVFYSVTANDRESNKTCLATDWPEFETAEALAADPWGEYMRR